MKPRVAIGVRVRSEPQQLYATLAALRAHTDLDHGARLLLLPDDPDTATAAALARIRNLPQLPSDGVAGAPACFNRLLTCADEPLLLFLESGTLPSPGWLDLLVAAVDADPKVGLAGPSTNRSWNEQAAFPRSPGNGGSLVRTARMAAQRFGSETRTLLPLHSLADFCYLVRREVVDAIGGADEGYGLGPCWEMDYNLRAARAGFRAVWVGAAFVHRMPATAARNADEGRLFNSSRRLYQDRFCGQRMRGERTEYEAHCTGEECPDFAPAAAIQLRVELRRPPAPPPPAPAPVSAPAPSEPPRITSDEAPLVTCIMPTYNRRPFIERAVAGVLGQSYPNLELLILDDGSDPIENCLPADPRVRYQRLEGRSTIGKKRNLACQEARGELICHFDDDDWYPRWRVRRQVEALRDADVCGTSSLYYLDGARGWRYQYSGPGPWVAGNTLAYRRSLWQRHPFHDVQVGEDSRFVRTLKGSQVRDLHDPSLCIGRVHAGNTSPKPVGRTYWHPEPAERLRQLMADEEVPTAPLVSCIMPTADRRRFVELALDHFERQDWPSRELIIVDDGFDSVEDLTRGRAGVRYLRVARKRSIGRKRNLACREATGMVIAHWDDDDWYAPDRLRRQVEPIVRGEAELTGLEMRYLLHLPSGEFWTAERQLHQKMFIGDVHGGTLAFRRSLFERGLQYPEINLAEDAAFIKRALQRGHRLARIENPGSFVYVRHGKNAWQFEAGRFLDPGGWTRTQPPPCFSTEALAAYQAAMQAPAKS
jgi:glycosyltransferase involved in cell wall biosynthesis